MSVFAELLRIKEFRESQAETEARRRRAVLDEAVQALERGERRLEEYRAWSGRHELDLYAEICTRVVKLRDLDDLRGQVTDMRQQERNLEQGVRDAEKLRREAGAALDAAFAALREAGRQKNKFTELARIYSEEARLELERAEDLEMEEFRSPDAGDDEWEGAEHDADTPVH